MIKSACFKELHKIAEVYNIVCVLYSISSQNKHSFLDRESFEMYRSKYLNLMESSRKLNIYVNLLVFALILKSFP